jgi:hypothetical protein
MARGQNLTGENGATTVINRTRTQITAHGAEQGQLTGSFISIGHTPELPNTCVKVSDPLISLFDLKSCPCA